ncbi:hypothetical protein FOXB_07922 [Fusarium oxysporum f. sp. conglutinans Fo5176]|uniref:Uncharacterized protein n=1 Tax=Fusarium oxysporum (strain Fo5176) TaxID=660025 RepID=F9FNE2_FUSOF|nr:hypothetical protein FOXB_07922 [Fusarium oxysporum f. sp. conglutinans Fo5176]
MVATVVPFFLPHGSVRLGTFIKNINHPLEGYHEPPTSNVPKAIVTPFSFPSQNQQNRKTEFGSALTSLISAGFSKRLQSQVHLAPARGNNYCLDNSDAWFDKAVSLPETREWIEKAALRGHKIYIIVGIQTFIDARIVQKLARGRQARGQATVPVSLFLAAATAAMPFADLVDPAIREHQNAESDQLWLLAPGEQVWSLQYQSNHGQVPPEDASRNSLMHTGTATTLPACQTVPRLRPWIDKLMTDVDGRQSVTRRELTTGRNFAHKVAAVR